MLTQLSEDEVNLVDRRIHWVDRTWVRPEAISTMFCEARFAAFEAPLALRDHDSPSQHFEPELPLATWVATDTGAVERIQPASMPESLARGVAAFSQNPIACPSLQDAAEQASFWEADRYRAWHMRHCTIVGAADLGLRQGRLRCKRLMTDTAEEDHQLRVEILMRLIGVIFAPRPISNHARLGLMPRIL